MQLARARQLLHYVKYTPTLANVNIFFLCEGRRNTSLILVIHSSEVTIMLYEVKLNKNTLTDFKKKKEEEKKVFLYVVIP